jgi:DME family drug/metabolite transporter
VQIDAREPGCRHPAQVPDSSVVSLSTRGAVVSALLGAALFGTAGTAQALGPDTTSPIGVGVTRLLVGGLGLVLALPLLGHRPREALTALRSPLTLVAGLCLAGFQVGFFGGVDRVGVALGTLVTVGSSPLFAGLLSWFTGHPPTRTWAAATTVCLAGLVLLSSEGLGGGEPVGVLLALSAGLAIATYTVVVKKLLDGGAQPAPVLASSTLAGGVVLGPLLLTQPMSWLGTPGGLALALYLGLATMTVANLLYGRALSGLSPGPMTTLMLADPIVATTLGVLLLDEALSALAWIGLLLVLAGLVLQGVTAARARPGHEIDPGAPEPTVSL